MVDVGFFAVVVNIEGNNCVYFYVYFFSFSHCVFLMVINKSAGSLKEVVDVVVFSFQSYIYI